MPDEPKNPAGESKPETPKEIEDVLKELPKVPVPKPSSPLLPPRPQTSSPSPPPPPSPKPPSPRPDKFQSFVRTMESDLEAAKKGLKPESKPFEIKSPPPPSLKASEGTAKPLAPTAGVKPPTQPLKLGPAEKSKPLETPKPLVMPPKPPTPAFPPLKPGGPPSPPKGFPVKINSKLLIIVLIVILAFAGIWFFMTQQQEPEIVFTPTPTATPTPSPLALSELFLSENRMTIPSTQNFETTLKNEIKNIALPAGGFTALEILDENGIQYPISQIMAKLSIKPPAGLLESLDPSEWTLVLYGQTEIFDKSGFPIIEPSAIQGKKLGLVAKTDNPSGLRNALNTWEITMTDDLKGLFEIDPRKATSQTFLDNIYSGQTVRYRNFPYADRSIDYSSVYLAEFDSDYFILTNSRESIYSAIDLLQNQ